MIPIQEEIGRFQEELHNAIRERNYVAGVTLPFNEALRFIGRISDLSSHLASANRYRPDWIEQPVFEINLPDSDRLSQIWTLGSIYQGHLNDCVSRTHRIERIQEGASEEQRASNVENAYESLIELTSQPCISEDDIARCTDATRQIEFRWLHNWFINPFS
ncbi:hypothetical protein CL614_07295 [archaeon]|nr:hypothetical protein [archaeon]|tara:strand:- start:2145 stop:2627 length:483 start_codon:yes stop_codon:yes gene_type:complete